MRATFGANSEVVSTIVIVARTMHPWDHDALSLLLFALLALDMGSAARDLARNVTAALAGDPVVLSFRNLSTLGPAETAGIRHTFEAELRSAGARIADSGRVEARLTVSEDPARFLLIAEIRHGDDRQVLLGWWPRTPAASQTRAAPVTLERKPLWEQERPILDVALIDGEMLVLDPFGLTLIRGAERQTVPIPPVHTWPRDLRGRLAANATGYTAWLPGVVCRGGLQPQLTMDCADSREPWPLAPGASAVLVPGRNFFEGKIEAAPWGTGEVPPFYSAAQAGEAWLFAGVDGKAHIYTPALEAGGRIDQWGSEIAGVQTSCGPRVLATRPGGNAERDAILPFEIVQGAANAAGPALEFSGPITALRSAGGFAVAISRDLETGRYAAFSLAPSCGS